MRSPSRGRVAADGRFLTLDGAPFRVRGVTYGSFARRVDGAPFPERSRLKQDLVDIVGAGLNTVRTYDLPPVELFDFAEEVGIRVIVGVDFHDWRTEPSPGRNATRRILDAGRRAIDEALTRCAGRPSVLAIAVGNEVPADLVRLHGPRRVADVLGALIVDVHTADPDVLATYVNYPTTEFLHVEGCDIACFNVFLESTGQLRRYTQHLQVACDGLPLVLTELGLGSAIHGEDRQAALLESQLSVVDECGCAGASVFSWTDEWAVADEPVEGWGFGVTTSSREPKPALDVLTRWARRASVRELRPRWPRVSVVVCAYNEETTIEECLASLAACDYPDLEVIVCDDGSTDRTAERASAFRVRVLGLPHGGLSRARNAGFEAASGEVVAYLDADAACHPDWPYHLVLSLDEEGVVATGGPNLPFQDAGFVERAVALSPGQPREVLLGDDLAEHVPGCNMAYRKSALASVGAFDPVYTAAGDDVDVCWKLLDRGSRIAFSPAAQVRHHRRRAVRPYLRQQRGYGRAERILARAHPDRFNRFGQAGWAGVIYGGSRLLPRLLRPVVYHGRMGGALFQPVVRRRAEPASDTTAAMLPLALPVVLASLAFAIVSPWALLAAAAALGLVVMYGTAIGATARIDRAEPHPLAMRALVGVLHVCQPFARLSGRLSRRSPATTAIAARVTGARDTPEWRGDRLDWLVHLVRELRARRCAVHTSAPHDRWDLEVSVSVFLRARLTTAVVWRWEPRHHVRYGARPALWGIGALGAGLALLGSWTSWMVVTIVLVTVATEFVLLRSKVAQALEITTRGARP